LASTGSVPPNTISPMKGWPSSGFAPGSGCTRYLISITAPGCTPGKETTFSRAVE